MGANNPVTKFVMNKGQGTAARLLDCLPSFAQERLVKALDYPYDYPDLDPYIKCLM
ncbi:esterase, partial [Acinetobacter schindleri]